MEDKGVVLVANNPMLKQLDHSILGPLAESNHLVIFNKAKVWRQFQPFLKSYSMSFLNPITFFPFRNATDDNTFMNALCGAEKILVLKGLGPLNTAFKMMKENSEYRVRPTKVNHPSPTMWVAQVLNTCKNYKPDDLPPELHYSYWITSSMPKKGKPPFPSSGMALLSYYLAKDHPNINMLGFNSTVPGYVASPHHTWKFETQVMNLLAELGRVKLLYKTL